MDNITVVILNDFDYVQGGATKVAIETAQLLYENNINVIFFSAVHKDNDYSFHQITTNQKEMVNDPNKIKAAINNLYNFKAKKEFKKLLKTLDPTHTIIHVHGWTKALSSSVLDVSFKMKFKVVLTAHDYFTVCPNGGFYNYSKNKICNYRPLSKDCIKCACDSRNNAFKAFRILRQLIQNYYVGFTKKLKYLITISNFSEKILKNNIRTDLQTYRVYNPTSIIEKKDRISILDNDQYVFVGRIAHEKGVIEMLNVFAQTEKKLVLVGDGPLLEQLKEQYKLNSNILFVGWKSQEEVFSIMSKSVALIFPSLWYEGAPLTIFEAMSIGLPCIVSNRCSAVDFVDHMQTGVIIDPTDIYSFQDALSIHKENLDQYSKNAYKIYWNNPYSKERYIKTLLNVYNQILKD